MVRMTAPDRTMILLSAEVNMELDRGSESVPSEPLSWAKAS